MTSRLADLERFYEHLAELQTRIGGWVRLDAMGEIASFPARGVYFFSEDGENRSDSGSGPRVVRVGTHALSASSRTTLKDRLSQHRGTVRTLGGNHRGSVFRKLIGEALIARRDVAPCATWGVGNTASRETRLAESDLEAAVSTTIGKFSMTWLAIDDEPGPGSLRGFIERNAIALLSNFGKTVLDAPSTGWLGRTSLHQRVVSSGLWNNNHVDEAYDPAFLAVLSSLIDGRDSVLVLQPAGPMRSSHATPSIRKTSGGTNESRILAQLQGGVALDDDELATMADIQPRQTVNQICRRLERTGVIRRFVGPRNKIVNELTETEVGAFKVPSEPKHLKPVMRAALKVKAEGEHIVYEPAKTLILIPCSGTKRQGGVPGLKGPTILDDITPPLALRLTEARKIQLEKSACDGSRLLPAAERYYGTLYAAAGSPLVELTKNSHAHLLIISGGYGVVRPDEPIGDYDARFKFSNWPKDLLEEVLRNYTESHALSRVVAFASATTDYSKLIRKTNWRQSWVESAVLISPEGSTGAMVKSPRAQGEALQAFCTGTLTTGFRSSDGLGIEVQSLL